jgi:hypothetical protein
MKIEIVRNKKQISADDGKWLYNETNRDFFHKVILGSKSTEAMWKEITEEEKTKLEALWNAEISTEEATEADYISILNEKDKIIDILSGERE